MDSQIKLKLSEAVRAFSVSLDAIEREAQEKVKEYERSIQQYNQYLAEVKAQEKANDKKLELQATKLDEEISKQNVVSRQLSDELEKQAKLTGEIEKAKADIDENKRTSDICKGKLADLLDERKKLTQELKDKIAEVDKLKNDVIFKEKSVQEASAKLVAQVAEFHKEKARLDKDRIDYNDARLDLDLKIKNVERVQKQLKLEG